MNDSILQISPDTLATTINFEKLDLLTAFPLTKVDTLPAINLPLIERVSNWGNSSLIGTLLLGLFLLFIIAFNLAKSFHLETLRNFFRDKDRITYEEADNTSLSILILLIIACVNFALFTTIIFNITSHLPSSEEYFVTLFISLGIVIGWLILQLIGFKITGFISHLEPVMKKFIRSFTTTFIVCGLVIFPVVLAMIYSPTSNITVYIYIGAILMIIATLLIILKAFQLFFNGFQSLCYLFLYLCTLEIVPFLLVKKAFMLVVGNV